MKLYQGAARPATPASVAGAPPLGRSAAAAGARGEPKFASALSGRWWNGDN